MSLVENGSAALSYRSDGPNVEYKSLRNMELTPYVMEDGSWYRDMLTIEASRAVGQFAHEFHKFPRNNVRIFSKLAYLIPQMYYYASSRKPAYS